MEAQRGGPSRRTRGTTIELPPEVLEMSKDDNYDETPINMEDNYNNKELSMIKNTSIYGSGQTQKRIVEMHDDADEIPTIEEIKKHQEKQVMKTKEMLKQIEKELLSPMEQIQQETTQTQTQQQTQQQMQQQLQNIPFVKLRHEISDGGSSDTNTINVGLMPERFTYDKSNNVVTPTFMSQEPLGLVS